MSPRSTAGTAGRRRSSMDGKPVGRLNPSEPLHMTTRRAAAKVNANTSPSTNGSVGDDDARRASLDDARPVASSGLGNPGRRNPGELMNGISDINTSFGAHRSVERPSGKVKSKPVSSPSKQAKMHESPSPTRKRKRSTPPTPERIPYGLEYAFPHMRETNLDAYLDDDKDRVVVVPPELLSDRESEDDSSDEHEIEDYLAATQSTEITPAATPAASEPVSPVSDESQPTPLYPSKHVDVIMADADQMLEGEEADGGDELADADDGLDEDEVEVEDEDGQSHVGRKKRPYGRRRAEHPVPEVEARMRRQQQLKQAYRYISRALKPILAEIADKTVEELETKPTVHEEVPEYCGNEEEEGVQQLLDQYLTRRKAQLEAQRDFCQAQLRRTLDGERQVRKARCENDIENRREHQVDTLHHDFLLIARQAQLDAGNASYETEDEDEDVIPKLKGMAYRWKRKAALDPAYDSRSRLAMESENAILDLQRRLDMHNMLKDLDDDEKTEDAAEGFTVMESTPREAALARRQNLLNTSILAEAAASVEREVPVIPNEQALGLQLLGDLASRPSIRANAPPPPFAPFGPQLLRQPLAGPPIPAQMPPPPPLRPPISFDREADEGPIRATMSPRTERFVNERGGLPFLLQSPLRQQSMAESRPSEPLLPSPSRSSRGSTTQPVPLQALVSESRNHPLLASPQHQRHTSTDSFDRSFAARDRSESSVPGASDREDSSWEKYRRPLTAGSHSRTPSYQDRAVHEFSHGGPLSIERIATQPEESPVPRASTPPHQPALASQGQLEAFPQPSPLGALELALQASPVPAAVTTSVMSTPVRTAEENHPAQGFTRDESPTHPPHPPKTLPKWDPPSSEGAADSRSQDEGQASEEPKRDLSLEVPTKKSRSRASSLGQSTNTDVSGSQDGSNADSAGARRPQRDSSKGREKFKPNKSDRHGLSRKQHKERRKGASHTTSLDGGQMLRFRLNTSEPTKSPAFTSGPPTGTPHTTHPGLTPYPPLPAYNEPQHQPFPQPGLPPPPPSPRYGYDHSQYYGGHRNSLPGPTGVPAPPWPPHPPSPAYGLPHGLPQHPPPHPHPGWSGSPSNGLGPPPPGLGPQPAAAASHSRYQGPAIAPATPDSRTLGYGGTRSAGGNHPPAFAQQLRNNESSGSRRRTQSDVRGTKFHHYPGPRHKDSA